MKINWKEWEYESRRSPRPAPTLYRMLGPDWKVYYYMFFTWLKDKEFTSTGTIYVFQDERKKFISLMKLIEKEI